MRLRCGLRRRCWIITEIEDADLRFLWGPVDRKAVLPSTRQHAASDLPAPAIQSFESYASPINDNTISSHRQRDTDLHASGSYDPRDTPAAFRKAKMAGENNNGAAPPPSLREIAEQAYDDLEAGAEAEAPRPLKGKPPAEEPLASEERPRDKSGRWVAKSEAQTGEAIARPPRRRSSPEARSFRDPCP